MKSFVKAAVALAVLQGALATPVSKRENNGWPWYNTGSSSVDANGANGGNNYGGDGANGGNINISQPSGYGRRVSASGANGGTNRFGNGANGGEITVGRRAEEGDLLWPFRPFHQPTRGPTSINANGADGGYNYGGNGANGGQIEVTSRAEETEETNDFFIPLHWKRLSYGPNGGDSRVYGRAEESEKNSDFILWPTWNYPTKGSMTASGANGGTNYYGDGANGGRIALHSRAEESQENSDSILFWPFWNYPTKGSMTASGANGGTNYYGDGANGGKIEMHGRGEEAKEKSDFTIPIWNAIVRGRHSGKSANGVYNS